MKKNASSEELNLWTRPPLDRDKPIRKAGGLYRTAEGGRPGIGGLPLATAQDTAVAAVRMAYRVAEAQIDRSARLAKRLREAGDRAVGARSDRKAVDATEQLIQRAVMSVLAWVEGLAGERDPVRRLMAAQYQIAGSMFGLTPSQASSAGGDASDEAPRAADAAPPPQHKSTGSSTQVKVVLKGDKRPVRIKRYEVVAGVPAKIPDLLFFSSADAHKTLTSPVTIEPRGQVTLEFTLTAADQGSWKAAVCDEQNVQLGVIEIEI
jgi:hypothetical protein